MARGIITEPNPEADEAGEAVGTSEQPTEAAHSDSSKVRYDARLARERLSSLCTAATEACAGSGVPRRAVPRLPLGADRSRRCRRARGEQECGSLSVLHGMD